MKSIFYVISVAVFGIAASLHAQPTDSQETITKIKNDIVDYLRTNEDLEVHNSLEDYEQRLTIIECVDKTALGYKKVGVYAFGVNTSHSKTYLLLKNDLQYQIVDPDNFVVTLGKVIALAEDDKLSNAKTIAYVESVIRIYEMNESRNPARLESEK